MTSLAQQLLTVNNQKISILCEKQMLLDENAQLLKKMLVAQLSSDSSESETERKPKSDEKKEKKHSKHSDKSEKKEKKHSKHSDKSEKKEKAELHAGRVKELKEKFGMLANALDVKSQYLNGKFDKYAECEGKVDDFTKTTYWTDYQKHFTPEAVAKRAESAAKRRATFATNKAAKAAGKDEKKDEAFTDAATSFIDRINARIASGNIPAQPTIAKVFDADAAKWIVVQQQWAGQEDEKQAFVDSPAYKTYMKEASEFNSRAEKIKAKKANDVNDTEDEDAKDGEEKEEEPPVLLSSDNDDALTVATQPVAAAVAVEEEEVEEEEEKKEKAKAPKRKRAAKSTASKKRTRNV